MLIDSLLSIKQRQRMALRKVLGFCENRTDCRKVELLRYFNETNKKPEEVCGLKCDNCLMNAEKGVPESRNLTAEAKSVISLGEIVLFLWISFKSSLTDRFAVEKVESHNITSVQCVDTWRGAKSAKYDGLSEFGAGRAFSKTDGERLIHELIIRNYLQEDAEKTPKGFIISWVRVGVQSGQSQMKPLLTTKLRPHSDDQPWQSFLERPERGAFHVP